MTRAFRCIKRAEKVGSHEIELNTDPAEGAVKIQSITATNFGSTTKKLSIGIRNSGGDNGWHPVGEPWTNIETNYPRATSLTFYLTKGDTVSVKFEGINLSRDANGNPTFSDLELNVNGEYLEEGAVYNNYKGSPLTSGHIQSSYVGGPFGAGASGVEGPRR